MNKFHLLSPESRPERVFVQQVTYSVKRGSERGTGELHTTMEAEYVIDDDGGENKKRVPTPVNLTNQLSLENAPRSPPPLRLGLSLFHTARDEKQQPQESLPLRP